MRLPKELRRSSATPAPKLEELLQQMHALLANEADNEWQIGVLYNQIVDHKLAEKNGYKHARELFAKEFKALGQSTLSLYGMVAKQFSEELTRQYGVTKLGKLITYYNLREKPLPAGDPGSLVITISLRPDKTWFEKPFAECSRSELETAIRGYTFHHLPPTRDLNFIDALLKAVQAKLGERSKVVIKGHYDGQETELSLNHIRIPDLPAVLEALGSVPSNRPDDSANGAKKKAKRRSARPAPRSKGRKR